MVVLAIAWVPVVKENQGGQVFIYIQEISGYLSPPVCAVFLLGLLWKRCNEKVSLIQLCPFGPADWESSAHSMTVQRGQTAHYVPSL